MIDLDDLKKLDGGFFTIMEKLDVALMEVERQRAILKTEAYDRLDRLPQCRCGKDADRILIAHGEGLHYCVQHAPANALRCSHFGLGRCTRFAVIWTECMVHAPWPSEP